MGTDFSVDAATGKAVNNLTGVLPYLNTYSAAEMSADAKTKQRELEKSSAEARASLIEQEALATASERQKAVREQNEDERASRESNRGASRANWGSSGLEMSGSKALVDAAKATADHREDEESYLEEEAAGNSALLEGGLRAASIRASSALDPTSTLITLGSKVYGNGR